MLGIPQDRNATDEDMDAGPAVETQAAAEYRVQAVAEPGPQAHPVPARTSHSVVQSSTDEFLFCRTLLEAYVAYCRRAEVPAARSCKVMVARLDTGEMQHCLFMCEGRPTFSWVPPREFSSRIVEMDGDLLPDFQYEPFKVPTTWVAFVDVEYGMQPAG